MTFRCKTTANSGKVQYSQVGLRLFYPNCPKLNTLCSAKRGAYVPAITVCLQRLFTPLPTTADYITPFGGLALGGSAGVSSSHYEANGAGSMAIGGSVTPAVSDWAAYPSGSFTIGGNGVVLLGFPVMGSGGFDIAGDASANSTPFAYANGVLVLSGGTSDSESVGYNYVASGSFGSMGGGM